LASKGGSIVQESSTIAGRRSADMHELSLAEREKYFGVLVALDALDDPA
jgi:hypothetical protein